MVARSSGSGREVMVRRAGIIELARRAVCLALLVAAVLTTFGDMRDPAWISGLGVALAGIAIYVLVPRPRIPPGALHHERMPAVVMPDVVGFLLAGTFIALPLVVMASDPAMDGKSWLLVLWVLAPFGLLILWIAANHACTWVRLRTDGIEIATARRIVGMPFADIARISTRVRTLPAWVGAALALFGGLRGLGIALLHARRARTSIVFERHNGESVELPVDAFPELDRLARTVARAGVPLDGRALAHPE
jgi:hypothetical protein